MSEQAIPEQRPFFVYGTLLPNQPNYYLWSEEIVAMETAVYQAGRLYDMGNYPMLIKMPGETVVGMVMQIRPQAYATVLARLDELEGYNPQLPQGAAYQRVLQKVIVGNGRNIAAWIYLGDSQFVTGLSAIPSGDWVAHSVGRQLDMVDWWEDVKSVRDLHAREDD